MHGPKILVDSMVPKAGAPKPYKHGNLWQYHPRSDHHSKVACWGLCLDLLIHCSLLRSHAEHGLVGFGLKMRCGTSRREKKNLDLVICRPRSEPTKNSRKRRTFSERGSEIGVVMNPSAQESAAALPVLHEFPVGAVHLAVEAKACMTAFAKARPRL